MTSRFDATQSLAGLANFQRATVEHAFRRMYLDGTPSRRFLVADETGLGKSMVAKGLIAKTIEHLQDAPKVKRIDIIYVCSNTDLAAQNLKRIDVIGHRRAVASRLTMLALGTERLDSEPVASGKSVNLISFTPGTMPGGSWQTGTIDERALIHVILREFYDYDFDSRDERSSCLLFQGPVAKLATVQGKVEETRRIADANGGIEPTIAAAFQERCAQQGLLDEYELFLADTRGSRTRLPERVQAGASQLIGKFRTELARASVHALEPDLIVLDEFQRFRDLIDPNAQTESADLARTLFDFGNARVLLLSATPIKAFTFAEEAQAGGDDHEKDLGKILEFLTSGSVNDPTQISRALAEYRRCVVSGLPADESRQAVERSLTSVMSRTERPRVGDDGMLEEHQAAIDAPTPNDLVSWVALKRVADEIKAPMTLEYWKSAPYFANFLRGYKFGDKLEDVLKSGVETEAVIAGLRSAQTIKRSDVKRRRPIDFGSARLRSLAEKALGDGQAKMLWVPPSMPYHELGGPFKTADPVQFTKHLLFSSWAATPTAVASLLSHEADRIADSASSDTSRLEYRTEDGRPLAMTALALFWPNPELATLCDPLAIVRDDLGGELRPIAEVIDRATSRVAPNVETRASSRASSSDAAYWQVAVAGFGSLPFDDSELDVALRCLAGQDANGKETVGVQGLTMHVDAALRAFKGERAEESPPELIDTVVRLGLFSPGNIAWRSLGRLLATGHTVTNTGRWKAAASLASGFRTLFNRGEAIGLLDQLKLDDVYWRSVLAYCAAGDLQAVLDEHVDYLAGSEPSNKPLDDEALMILATKVRDALMLRPSTYSAFDPHHPNEPINFTSRFALRYGSGKQTDESERLPQIRDAFNSPFWPWVLATTSAGQEGIDFHPWCHSVVHWNTPPNPVDFEQREGRVNRHSGLVVRRNLAARHRTEVMRSTTNNPWRRAYELGLDERERLGELAPHWVYPGPARVQRTVLPFALSSDIARYERLKSDLALYRLTFGQPRQEDLLEVLKRRGVQHDQSRMAELQLRLTPPESPWTAE